jgi:ABC-2 type transport system ATP-binding protein
MTAVIEARELKKSYGANKAVDCVSFAIQPGRIVGLIGPNGAGKTTLFKAILGLTQFDGELRVLGRDPRSERNELMQDVCFIADVAVLPRWLRVSQALDFVGGVHPRFDRSRAMDFLRKTDIKMSSRVRELSKGMVTQLHLALILAIDARLLVLDEPTLGLDLLFRRQFYDTLLNDYFDKQRTIVLTTHQVEEIENLLTDVIFISRGHVVLDSTVDALSDRYVQLTVTTEHAAQARELKPFYEREVFGRVAMFFEGRTAAELGTLTNGLGEMRTPSVADLFVAKMQGGVGYDARVAGDGPPWTSGEQANACAKGGGS